MKVKIEGIIIGERKFKHNIEMPNYTEQMKDVYIAEWLRQQYPDKVKRICDIKAEII